MKKINLYILLVVLLSLSCEKDEEACGSNGKVAGECWDVASLYSKQFINGNIKFTRENLTLSFLRPGSNQERYGFTVRSNEDGVTPLADKLKELTTNITYTGKSLRFNGNTNATKTGILKTTFSKIDRESGLVTGSFNWEVVGEGAFSGTFSDVKVKFN